LLAWIGSPCLRHCVHGAPTGLQFCKGLCHRYMNNPVEANRCFNLARRDSRWGAPARYHMIDIFIDPNKDAFLGDADAASTGGPPQVPRSLRTQLPSGLTDDARPRPRPRPPPACLPACVRACTRVADGGGHARMQEHIADAERLLRELPRRRPEEKAKADMLECYLRMAAGGKQATHAVLEVFQKMPGAQTDNVPAMLGQCRAHIRLKQQPKARNILKRICKLTWRPEVAEEFEQALLMLADLYIQSGKYDLVQGACTAMPLASRQPATDRWHRRYPPVWGGTYLPDRAQITLSSDGHMCPAPGLCKRALQNNQSAAKAWEYLALVMEKEQSYADAADAYERAWHFSSEASASVGE
jgi:tetratricopeptide repeat protein 21B